MIFNLPLAKLYTNSLMSTLNSRRMWKAANDGSESMGHGPVSGGQRSRVNVNVLREGGGRKSTRVRPSHNSPSQPLLFAAFLCLFSSLLREI